MSKPSPLAENFLRQAIALQQQKRLPQAAQALEAAARASPAWFMPHKVMAFLLMRVGQLDPARQAFWQALKLNRQDADSAQALSQILRRARPSQYDPLLEEQLAFLFSSTAVRAQDLSSVTALLLRGKYALEGPSAEITSEMAENLSQDPLFIPLMCDCILVEPLLELQLTALRKSLLFERHPTAAQDRLLTLIARQCHNNAFAFHIEASEKAELSKLRSRLNTGPPQVASPEVWRDLIRLACYQNLADLPTAEFLAKEASPPADLRALWHDSLINPLKERALGSALPSFSGEDHMGPGDVSAAVREMYEESPYPRWLEPARAPARSLEDFLSERIQGLDRTVLEQKDKRLLVAGCGTGKQAIELALLLPNQEVLAFDFSRRSLGYAARKAEEVKVANLTLQQGNILDLDQLGETFSVIVCTGVLHHMADPLAGWRALLDRLAPGGLLQIALYSRIARQDIWKARARIAELGLGDSKEEIRTFRNLVLSGKESGFEGFLMEKDFCDLDGCRDMLFHRQEILYDLKEIAAHLKELDLEFMGFEHPVPEIEQAFQQSYPSQESLRDLAAWSEFEKHQPKSFITMYNFWCKAR